MRRLRQETYLPPSMEEETHTALRQRGIQYFNPNETSSIPYTVFLLYVYRACTSRAL